MSKESKNKASQRRVWEEVFNKGNLTILPELFAPNYVFHTPLPLEAKGPEGFKQMVVMVRTAMPDLHTTVDDIFAEGDKVATRFTLTGTFKGEMMGISPTGKKVTVTGMLITRWVGGKEVEAWESPDTLAFYRQLGIPIPPQ
jgi:predicted ester cyclase